MLLLFYVLFNMHLHPRIDQTVSSCYDKYDNVSLDEFDDCDYVAHIVDTSNKDLVVIQLNVRGIGTKWWHLIELIDDTAQNRHPDLILLSETWVTPFSLNISIPGYELYHLDRQHKKGGGVGILVCSKLRCNL